MLHKCTIHRGGFELVGPRVTGQASDYICCAAGNSLKHMYFRMDTDRNLFPQVNFLNNSLNKQALIYGYTCGYIYTLISLKLLGLKDNIDLCDQSIFTQQFFCNTKHFDYNFLYESTTALVLNDTKVMKDPYINGYIQWYRALFHYHQFPCTTECFWTIFSNDKRFRFLPYVYIINTVFYLLYLCRRC